MYVLFVDWILYHGNSMQKMKTWNFLYKTGIAQDWEKDENGNLIKRIF